MVLGLESYRTRRRQTLGRTRGRAERLLNMADKNIRVKDVMTRDPATVGPQDSLRVAIETMATVGCRRLPVISGGLLVGIVADLDIREALNSPIVLRERWQDEQLMDHATVEACMTVNPITVTPDTPAVEAARLMRDHKVGGLPVMEGSELVGIVTETDLLDALIKLLMV
jgi:acetoin utilization protein AcuB